MIGLLLTVALFAAVGSAVVTAVAGRRAGRVADQRARRMDAYAQWLAACMGLNRSSASFVAAFRALAAEDRDSKYFALRQEEAQRARTDWCSAQGELERAEAALVVWSEDPSVRERLACGAPVAPEELQSAINGGQGDLDAFMQRLRSADARAAEIARRATRTHTRRDPLRELSERLAVFVATIVEQWGRR
jgi:hypothetical protein